jgi:aminoglycoside phosphotransferase (APT) family kinase protein
MNEEVDRVSEKLIAYLRDQLNDPMIGYESPLTQLEGGFETHIYRFELKGAQKEFARPLILRLYPEYSGIGGAVWESIVQNVLAAEGYPVAKAHMLCIDMSILGGAFFIMDLLPGTPLVTAPLETIPELLGRTHAALHSIDPKPLIKSLAEQGIDESMCRLDNRFEGLKDKASKFPWLRDAADWLIEYRPPEPEQRALCHHDFHPGNILVQGGVVTGVLDWPGFLIADPALDVANTTLLVSIPFKHLASTLGLDFSSVDWKSFEQEYLDAYQAEKSLDESHLDYYRVMRCVKALTEGSEGQTVWLHPPILKDLLDNIHSVTGIQITTQG